MKPIVTPQPADSGAVRGMISALRGRYSFLQALPIGQTALGRDIYGIVLGGGREAVLYAAAFHGQEWITSLILLRLCEEMAAALNGDGVLVDMDLQQALAGRSLVMVPQVNPDGVEIALHGPETAGRYMPLVSALDPEGKHWQANARGVDINHNFDAGWKELKAMELENGIHGPSPRQWCGPAPESEAETAALVKLCHRAKFRHVLALHSQGEEIYWRYGDRTPVRARTMADILGASSGYRVADPEGMASHGGFKDWFISAFGRPGFTIEFGLGENPLPLEDFEPIYRKTREMLLLAALM